MKAAKVRATRKYCLCGLSIGHAERDAAFLQGEMPLSRKKCRILKISCEFKKQDK
jgi:hypothetical protein